MLYLRRALLLRAVRHKNAAKVLEKLFLPDLRSDSDIFSWHGYENRLSRSSVWQRKQDPFPNSIRLDRQFGRPRNAVDRKRQPKMPSASRTFQVVAKGPAEKRVPSEGVGVGPILFAEPQGFNL